MTIFKGIEVPAVARDVASTNPLLALELNDVFVEAVPADDIDKARRRMQSKAANVTKNKGYRFAIRVLRTPIAGIDVVYPAIGVWRIV